MSKLLIVVCAVIAVARAGNFLPAVSYEAPPTAYGYAAAPLTIHAPAVGTSHQSTLRSLDGNSAISHYSKSVDSAFSSVRKVDTRVTNDAKILAPALTYAAPYAAPYAAQYAAPYAAPYAAHIVKTAAPEHYTYAAESPVAAHVISHTAFTGLGTAYAF